MNEGRENEIRNQNWVPYYRWIIGEGGALLLCSMREKRFDGMGILGERGEVAEEGNKVSDDRG